MRIIKFRALFASALFISLLAITPGRAVILNIDIGVIEFGTGLPDPVLPIGMGTLTGGFDFDTVTRLASNVAFLAAGTAGGHDGLYDTPSPAFISTTGLRVFKSAGPSTSVLNLTIFSLDPFLLDIILATPPIFGQEPMFGASNVTLGTCTFVFFDPCGGSIAQNTIGTTSSMSGPGVGGIPTVPLPAALPLFVGGLGLMGLVGRRKKQTSTA